MLDNTLHLYPCKNHCIAKIKRFHSSGIFTRYCTFRVSFILVFLEVLISIPWKTAKNNLSNCFLKKIKSHGGWNYENGSNMAKDSETNGKYVFFI